MRLVSIEEYIEIAPIIRKEMGRPAKHEKKNSYLAQTAINNCNVRLLPDKTLLFPNTFFMGTWEKGNRPNTFETSTVYLGKRFTLEFYLEENSNVAFVNTLIPVSI